MTNNPLLQKHSLPAFDKIQLKHIKPALDSVLSQNRIKLKHLLAQKTFNWHTLMTPLSEMENRLHEMWSPVSHLNSVMNSTKLRKIYELCLQEITLYETELDHNIQLFRAVKSIKQSLGFKKLHPHKQRVINNCLRDFKLSGVTLPEEKKKEFMALEQRLAELSNQFSNNILDATHAWHAHITKKNELSGIPEQFIEQARTLAKGKHKKGWLFGLDIPTYQAITLYADNRKLREKMYKAFVTRASDQGPNANQFDNSKIIEEILSARHSLANLVGFKNFADYSLAPKMAKNSHEVLNFITDLITKSMPSAKRELAQLKRFAKTHYKIQKLNAWDLGYTGEKLQQHLFNLSQEKLRPYFPEEKVLSGMFKLVEILFNIKIKEKQNIKRWHQDVRYFEIFETKNRRCGSFYVDLFARPKKHGGAWMDDCRSRHQHKKGKTQLPVAYLTCNFNKPAKNNPSLLTHNEVITLFHEFGHCLQHLLTKINLPEISGIHGVEWDAVELSSQLMENFCWQKPVIQFISAHHQTGEPLPDEILEQLLASKHFQAGLQMLRQLSLALFDFRLHHEYDPVKKISPQKLFDQVRKKTSLFPTPSYNRFQNGFSHIFAGGYAAGYYSYKWAEVLSSDAFEKFEHDGVLNKKIGQAFKKAILETGGSEDALTLFKKFRGRKPSIDALLKSSCMAPLRFL